MIQSLTPLLTHWNRAVTIILGLGTAAGWGMLAISSQAGAETERQLREQITALQSSQKQLVQERDQSQVAAAELAQLRNQLTSAQDEIVRLTQSRTHAQLKGPADRLPLGAGSSSVRLPQTSVSQISSIRSLPPTPPQAPVRPTQAALTKPQGSVMVAQTGDGKRQAPVQSPALRHER